MNFESIKFDVLSGNRYCINRKAHKKAQFSYNDDFRVNEMTDTKFKCIKIFICEKNFHTSINKASGFFEQPKSYFNRIFYGIQFLMLHVKKCT